MVVEAVVVGVDGTCPEAPGWVTISYQLSKTEHTTRDGKLELARLENEAALGVCFAYTGAFRARLRAALGGTVIEATPPGIDGVFENLSDGEYLLEVEKDPDATFQPHVNDAVARRMRDMGASSELPADDDDDFETALSARMAAMAATENDAGCDDGVVELLVEASMPPVVADAPPAMMSRRTDMVADPGAGDGEVQRRGGRVSRPTAYLRCARSTRTSRSPSLSRELFRRG